MTGTNALNGSGDSNPGQASTGLLTRLFDVIQRVGRPCIVCSQVRLKHQEVAALISLPLVVGVILDSKDHELQAAFPCRLGFLTKSGSDWQLPEQIAADMVYVGRWTDFGSRVAWLALRAGIRRIHNASALQSYHTRGSIWVAIEKSLRSLLYRLWQSSMRHKFGKRTGIAFRLEQYLFAQKLRVIEYLPLPITVAPSSWQKGKIVMVGGTLGPGGAERQLTGTLLGLFERGHRDIHFLHHSPMLKPNDFFLPQLIEAGIPFSQVDQIGDSNPMPALTEAELARRLAPLGDFGFEIAAYAREFLVRRPAIVHVWLDHTNVVAGLAAVLIGVPRIVLSCRSLSPVHFAFHQPYMRPIYRLLAKFPNVTILNNSETGAADYKRWLGVASLNIQVIQNGFDFSNLPSAHELSDLRGEYRRRLGIPEDAPVLGVIMRVSEEKRPFLWVEIARQVAQKISKAHFIFIGDGPMLDHVKKVAQSSLLGKIHFPGHEKNSIPGLAAMSLLLLTSRVEGLPNVLIEAQALGIPPIAIDVGGVSETMMVGESGWLMDTDNPQTISNKIIEILNQPERVARASAMGKNFVSEEFCRKKMIAKTLALYGIK